MNPSMVTSRIISPPPRNGGMASRSSSVPHSTPMPVGPHILWPVKATKSAPRPATSVARWGTYWQASTTAMAPAAWAAAASRSTGVSVPSTFDMAAKPTTLAPSTQAVEVGEVEVAVGADRDPAQLDAELGGEQVPRDDVGVVLELGEHDGVAGPEVGAAPGLGHEVERLGGVLGEDDLAGCAGADEAGDLRAGALERGGGLLGDEVDAAVHVGVGRARSTCSHRVEHGAAASARWWPSRGRRGACRGPRARGSGSPS